MPHAITGIDHPLIAVRDLEAARAGWSRLGFTVTPRGRHIGWATANYCIMFPDNYVELLGVVDPTGYAAGLPEQLDRHGEGMLRLALASRDDAETAASLRAAGIAAADPKALKRLLELPEGDVEPAFALVHLPDGVPAGLGVFACRHLTPDLVRRPDWLRHQNGATGIAAVTAVVDDPASHLDIARRLFGGGAVTMTDATLTIRCGGTAIMLVSPHDLEALHPNAGPRTPGQPARFVALRFACLAPARLPDLLRANGVAHAVDLDGTVRIDPDLANGVVVEFGRATAA